MHRWLYEHKPQLQSTLRYTWICEHALPYFGRASTTHETRWAFCDLALEIILTFWPFRIDTNFSPYLPCLDWFCCGKAFVSKWQNPRSVGIFSAADCQCSKLDVFKPLSYQSMAFSSSSTYGRDNKATCWLWISDMPLVINYHGGSMSMMQFRLSPRSVQICVGCKYLPYKSAFQDYFGVGSMTYCRYKRNSYRIPLHSKRNI